MTDLFDEWWTQRNAINAALSRGGDVLITGLGLGLIVESMLREPNSSVERIIVVERSADVIQLVAPTLAKRYRTRLDIVRGDAFGWWPPDNTRFSVAWHDIWPNPHEPGVLAAATALEARFAPYCDWQGSWVRDYREAEHGGKIAATG